MEYNMGQLADAIAHISRLRQWLAKGSDLVRWWKMPTGKCDLIQTITGETIDKNPIQKIITYR